MCDLNQTLSKHFTCFNRSLWCFGAIIFISKNPKSRATEEKGSKREREIVWHNSEMTELGEKKERERKERDRDIQREKWKQVSSLHLWVSHPSLTFYREQTNSRTSSRLANGGQGVTGVRSQEAKEWANLKILWCLQDKGGSQGDGVFYTEFRLINENNKIYHTLTQLLIKSLTQAAIINGKDRELSKKRIRTSLA